MTPPTQANVIRYVAFDKKTGRILHTHSRFNAEKNEYVELPIEELKASLGRDSFLLERLTDRNPDNIGIIKTTAAVNSLKSGQAGARVDLKTRKIVEKPRLQLTAEKTELAGDGQDETTIEIQAVDANGKPVRDLDDTIKVATSRGKLSERGGVVSMVQGRAGIKLTSGNETVAHVKITAKSLTEQAETGALSVEFV